MTPKQKAKHLLNEFDGNKSSALFCVDEKIITLKEFCDPNSMKYKFAMMHLYDTKNQIEKQ